jgi:hypothetical protein
MQSMFPNCYSTVTTGSLLLESAEEWGHQRLAKVPQMRDLERYCQHENKKGQPGEELPLSVPRGGADRKLPGLDYGR